MAGGRIRVTVDDMEIIIGNLERNGHDASELKSILNEVKQKVNHGDSINSVISDDEHVKILMEQSPIEEGSGLICSVCHKPASKLYSGTCIECFRPWALSIKRRRK